ncbi:hypothetical protein M3638_04540 [Oceanobacillus profundus]|uniref:hypothetical protein n=1 Tax=Oceanobacillus profundus TaxID=372463 RepID=UPI00203BABB6|nr:hypothetical protein [Oceanobacillus profundus]MCM3397106.1 hypothetical protein [Oceanobacillus profundus]
MDTFVKNYWSLYLDFLKDFEKLNYKGFSLPYLCHLPSFIINREPIWEELQDAKFARKLKNQVNDQSEFQEVFNKFVYSHKKKASVKNKDGKVVLHVDKLLRFPQDTVTDYFDPSNTIQLFSTGKSKGQKAKPPAAAVSKTKGNKPESTTKIKKKKKAVPLSNTIIIKKENVKRKNVVRPNKIMNKLPVYYFNNYATNTEKVVSQVQNQAKVMLKAYKNHHLYKHNQFQEWLLNNIATVINQIEMSINFLNDVSVSCIVVSTTHSYKSRVLALVAAKKGIPTICMQHGIISSELGYIPKIATIDAVYGNFERDWFKKIGSPGKSLEIIGHPRFDQVYKRSVITRDKFNRTLGLNPNRQTLMIVVRGDKDNNSWRSLIKTISKKVNLNLVIKNYPSKKPHALTKEFPFVYSTQGYNIYDIFPNVDAVVAYSSTVGLEAMLAKKPVFILEETFVGYTGYYTSLGNLVQSDARKLGDEVRKYFTDVQSRSYAENKRNKFLRYAYPSSTKSGERLKNLINRLIS